MSGTHDILKHTKDGPLIIRTKIQKLERIVALCHRCHTATHVGLACVKGLGQLAKKTHEEG